MKSSSCSAPETQTQSSVCYQLTHSVTKPFKADIDWQSIDPKEKTIKKYICDQCLDEFIHESSLTTHLERRSVRISYLCDKCQTRLTFFNRCALLSHMRSHNQNNDRIDQKLNQQLSQVLVQPIDLNQLFDNHNNRQNISLLSKNRNQLNANNKTKTNESIVRNVCISKTNVINRQLSEDLFGSKGVTKQKTIDLNRNEKKKTINTSNDLINKKFVIKKVSNSELKCTECNHSFNSLSTREQHLMDKQLVVPLNQCKVCPTICATNCSQSIHNRLHTISDNRDRVCPECGSKLDSTDPITHIVINCLHFSRRLVYNCMFCSDRMSSLSAFAQHIKSIHTTPHFWCSQCSLQFETEVQLKQHQTGSHSSDSKPIVVHKCPICGIEVNSVNTYSDHLTTHRKKFCDFANFIFVCLECNESFMTKTDLKSHLNSFHIKDKTESERNAFFTQLSRDIAVQFKLKVDFDSDKRSNDSNNKTTNESSAKNTNINNKRNVSNSNGKDIKANESVVKRVKTLSDNWVNNEIKSEAKIESKDEQKSANNNNTFECRECGLNFPFVQTLKRHLILEHRIHDVESYINRTYIAVPIVVNTEPQLPKEVGEKRLSDILDSEDSTDTMCPICSQKFSNSQELKIHGRVHGMAFIKSCQKKAV